MNGPESVRTDGTSWGDQASMMAPLLREWILLREREIDLVRRIADLLEQSSRDRTTADGGPEAAVETGARGDQVPGDPPAQRGHDLEWIDRTIEGVLAGAFSSDDEPEAAELPAVDLLLLRSGNTWVGMPWESVTRLGLSDEAPALPPAARFSLRAILGLGGNGDSADETPEPYCLTWQTIGGQRSLCCEVLGGVLAASAAAAREVDLVWLPDDSEAGGRLVPLVEFFASCGRTGGREVDSPDHGFDDRRDGRPGERLEDRREGRLEDRSDDRGADRFDGPARARSPLPTMADPELAGSLPAPTPSPSVADTMQPPVSDPRAPAAHGDRLPSPGFQPGPQHCSFRGLTPTGHPRREPDGGRVDPAP